MRALIRSLLFAAMGSVFVLAFSVVAVADCAAPSSPGVRICSPTQNSVVAYPYALDLASTPGPGASITQFIVYDNNRETVRGFPGQTGETIIDFAIKNGVHNVVVNAWDTAGNLYQARVTFTMIGEGFQLLCDIPSTPGVNFCVPPPGSVFSVNVQVAASARGQSTITAMRIYADGKAVLTTDQNQIGASVNLGTQADHNITWVAWDSGGRVYTASKTVHPSYTYGYEDCPPKGNNPCSPGFDGGTIPAPNSYVPNSFRLQATIRNNPLPITTMKAYIDNTVAATSTGPIMDFPAENAPSGTHILTFQAWDTAGTLYRIQYNVNINVPH